MDYMHKKTGSVDTREGWIESYDPQELEARGLTAEQAFDEDEGETLIIVKPDYCTQNNGDCGTCSLANYNRDCRNRPIDARITGDKESVSQDRPAVKDQFLVCGMCLYFDDDFPEGAKAGDVCPTCGESTLALLNRRDFYRSICGKIVREMLL